MVKVTWTTEDMTGGAAAVIDATLTKLAAHKTVLPSVFEMEAVKVALDRAVAFGAQHIQPVLQEAYDSLLISAGERPEAPGDLQDDWDSAQDDAVEAALEPYERMLSVSWFGVNTIDCRLYEDGGCGTLARSAAKEIWSTLTWRAAEENAGPMTGQETLDTIGITRDGVKALLAERIPPSDEVVKEAQMYDRAKTLTKLHYTQPQYGGSLQAYKDDLELAWDADTILANGAISRLGGTVEMVPAFRAFAAEMSYDTDAMYDEIISTEHAVSPLAADAGVADETDDEADELAAMMGTAAPAAPPRAPPPSAPVAAKGPAPTARGVRAKAEAGVPANAIPGEVLAQIKEATGEKDETLATGVGVSRATFNNYVKGKGTFVPDDTQRAFLSQMLYSKRQAITAALEALGLE